MGVREGCKQNLAGESLHFLQCSLYFAIIFNGLLEPLILFFGQGDAHRFFAHFAGPLITRPSRTGTSILGVAFADPTGVSQLLAQFVIASLRLGWRKVMLHTKKLTSLSIGRY